MTDKAEISYIGIHFKCESYPLIVACSTSMLKTYHALNHLGDHGDAVLECRKDYKNRILKFRYIAHVGLCKQMELNEARLLELHSISSLDSVFDHLKNIIENESLDRASYREETQVYLLSDSEFPKASLKNLKEISNGSSSSMSHWVCQIHNPVSTEQWNLGGSVLLSIAPGSMSKLTYISKLSDTKLLDDKDGLDDLAFPSELFYVHSRNY